MKVKDVVCKQPNLTQLLVLTLGQSIDSGVGLNNSNPYFWVFLYYGPQESPPRTCRISSSFSLPLGYTPVFILALTFTLLSILAIALDENPNTQANSLKKRLNRTDFLRRMPFDFAMHIIGSYN